MLVPNLNGECPHLVSALIVHRGSLKGEGELIPHVHYFFHLA
jgi:hypothetical protein